MKKLFKIAYMLLFSIIISISSTLNQSIHTNTDLFLTYADKNQEKIRFERNTFFLNSEDNYQPLSAGTFETPSLKEIREEYKDKAISSQGPLKVIFLEGDSHQKASIESIQPLCNNNDSIHIASNFNTLELPEEYSLKSHQLGNYKYDKTQGPNAVRQAPEALMKRFFKVPQNLLYKKKEISQERLQKQTDDSYINLLQDVSPLRDLTSPCGYIHLTKKAAQFFDHHDEKTSVYNQEMERIRLGVHQNTTINYDKNYSYISDTSKWRRVNHLFSSTINLRNPTNRKALENQEKARTTIQKFLLNAYYEMIIKKAILLKSSSLYLTFTGGGVFENDGTLITEAVASNLQKVHHETSMKVYIVSYDGKSISQGKSLVEELKKNLEKKQIAFKTQSIREWTLKQKEKDFRI